MDYGMSADFLLYETILCLCVLVCLHTVRIDVWQHFYKKKPAPTYQYVKTDLSPAPSGTRTLDNLIKSQMLYQLS